MNLISLYVLTNNSDKAALLQKLYEWNLIPKEGEYVSGQHFPLRLGNAMTGLLKHNYLNVYRLSSRC